MHPQPPAVAEAALALQAAREDPVAAFVYDLPALARHCRQLRTALPAGVELFYAVKANSALPVLRTVARELHGLEVASGGELQLVATHFPGVPVVFGGPGKIDSELRAACAHPVDVLHVESLYELERLPGPVRVLLRVNPALQHGEDSPMLMAGKPSPFGMEVADLPAALELLARRPELDCLGFHLHTRSLQLDVDDHLRLLEGYFEAAPTWGLEVRQLNVGGGIGVNYRGGPQFDWPSFCQGLSGRLPASTLVRFECGRFITGFCGYYCVEVLDLKVSHGETFAVCRGGTHHFRLPAAQGHSHPFSVLPGRRRGPRVRDCRVNVVGQLCTPKDRLATAAPVEELSVGDLLVFPLAGAYGWNISHHDFLLHPHPEHIFLGEG